MIEHGPRLQRDKRGSLRFGFSTLFLFLRYVLMISLRSHFSPLLLLLLFTSTSRSAFLKSSHLISSPASLDFILHFTSLHFILVVGISVNQLTVSPTASYACSLSSSFLPSSSSRPAFLCCSWMDSITSFLSFHLLSLTRLSFPFPSVSFSFFSFLFLLRARHNRDYTLHFTLYLRLREMLPPVSSYRLDSHAFKSNCSITALSVPFLCSFLFFWYFFLRACFRYSGLFMFWVWF
ncbi:hypothetical protein B0H34DRAFT_703347 [Crassisporium funariophilum]|nr:hypothetical protein B0H34DRAFT_703347 [Crassisporium funariophilum]